MNKILHQAEEHIEDKIPADNGFELKMSLEFAVDREKLVLLEG